MWIIASIAGAAIVLVIGFAWLSGKTRVVLGFRDFTVRGLPAYADETEHASTCKAFLRAAGAFHLLGQVDEALGMEGRFIAASLNPVAPNNASSRWNGLDITDAMIVRLHRQFQIDFMRGRAAVAADVAHLDNGDRIRALMRMRTPTWDE